MSAVPIFTAARYRDIKAVVQYSSGAAREVVL